MFISRYSTVKALPKILVNSFPPYFMHEAEIYFFCLNQINDMLPPPLTDHASYLAQRSIKNRN